MASEKIIIENEGVSQSRALLRVRIVVNRGRISVAAGIKHYCWFTRGADGIIVATKRKRSESSADSFVVYKEADTDAKES